MENQERIDNMREELDKNSRDVMRKGIRGVRLPVVLLVASVFLTLMTMNGCSSVPSGDLVRLEVQNRMPENAEVKYHGRVGLLGVDSGIYLGFHNDKSVPVTIEKVNLGSNKSHCRYELTDQITVKPGQKKVVKLMDRQLFESCHPRFVGFSQIGERNLNFINKGWQEVGIGVYVLTDSKYGKSDMVESFSAYFFD